MFSTVIATAALLAASLGPSQSLASPTAPGHFTLTGFSTSAAKYRLAVSGSDFTGEEREFIARINTERRARGLYALMPDFSLAQVARAHSCDMCARNYFSHFAPTARLRSPLDRYLADLRSEGLPKPGHLTVGENIYYCSEARGGDDVALAHQALMNSPEHRDSILNPNFDRVGVGVWRDAHGQLWVTENFLSSSD